MDDQAFAEALKRLNPYRAVVTPTQLQAIRETTDPFEALTWAFLTVVEDRYLPEHLMILQGDRGMAIVNTETGRVQIHEHESWADLIRSSSTLPIPMAED